MDVHYKIQLCCRSENFHKIMKKVIFTWTYIDDDKMWGTKRIKSMQVHTLKVFHKIRMGKKEIFPH